MCRVYTHKNECKLRNPKLCSELLQRHGILSVKLHWMLLLLQYQRWHTRSFRRGNCRNCHRRHLLHDILSCYDCLPLSEVEENEILGIKPGASYYDCVNTSGSSLYVQPAGLWLPTTAANSLWRAIESERFDQWWKTQ